jgi:hypothetical protein
LTKRFAPVPSPRRCGLHTLVPLPQLHA